MLVVISHEHRESVGVSDFFLFLQKRENENKSGLNCNVMSEIRSTKYLSWIQMCIMHIRITNQKLVNANYSANSKSTFNRITNLFESCHLPFAIALHYRLPK